MDILIFCQDALEKILGDHAAIPYSYGEIKQYLIVDRDRSHFLLFNEGWNNRRRVHGCVVHAEVKDGKIWIHYDGTEDGITNELIAAGVPKERIVLAFHPPEVRAQMGYAVA